MSKILTSIFAICFMFFVVNTSFAWNNDEDEGCTPGFWKTHFIEPTGKDGRDRICEFPEDYEGDPRWVPTGLSPCDDFDFTFSAIDNQRGGEQDVDFFDPDITLLEALWLGGGGLNKCARHAVAALLNIHHNGIDAAASAFSDGGVKRRLQDGDCEELAEANEAGCPLNRWGEPDSR